MRISLFIILALITACNNSAKKKADTKDTVKQLIQMPATPDTMFTGFGTEPFWSVYVIRNNKIVFHPADGDDIEVPFVSSSTTGSISTKYHSASGTDTIDLLLTQKDCSDGMSDEVHPYEVVLMVNTARYTGCGRKEN